MATTVPSNSLFDVSVVIVSFNTREVLRECLESVRRGSGTLRVQSVVVDNCSGDGSREMVQREFPEVLLIRSDVNLGFAGANNLGFKSVRGRYIVLLNSDAFLAEEALQRSVRHMEENPHVGLGGARLMGRDTACARFWKCTSAACGSLRKRSAIHPAMNCASEYSLPSSGVRPVCAVIA